MNIETNEEINTPITEKEIEYAIKTFKNNKACGYDKIVNEQIKVSFPLMKLIYVKLFNLILDAGTIPELWTIVIINPIYKNKGDKTKPENYRPNTL